MGTDFALSTGKQGFVGRSSIKSKTFSPLSQHLQYFWTVENQRAIKRALACGSNFLPVELRGWQLIWTQLPGYPATTPEFTSRVETTLRLMRRQETENTESPFPCLFQQPDLRIRRGLDGTECDVCRILLPSGAGKQTPSNLQDTRPLICWNTLKNTVCELVKLLPG